MTNKPQTEEALKDCAHCRSRNVGEGVEHVADCPTLENDPRLKHYEELVEFVKACKQFGVVDTTDCADFDSWCDELLKQIEDIE